MYISHNQQLIFWSLLILQAILLVVWLSGLWILPLYIIFIPLECIGTYAALGGILCLMFYDKDLD